jgi:FSR family fosmidomycin resistance protein-like MFS transporter
MSATASARSATRPALLAFSLGHGAADLCSGALWSLLPFLVVERHYSYGAVGVFALVASLGSALLQPLFGTHGDRSEGAWLLPVGLIVGGLGIAAAGFTSSFPLTLAAVAVCSAGVAAYHPEGARWARLAAGSRVTADMSIFSLGGGVGWALGPLVVAAVVVPLGLKGTLLIPLVPLAAAAAVTHAVRHLGLRLPAGAQRRQLSAARAQQWQPFVRLLVLNAVASGVGTGLITYVPLFLVHARGTSPGTANVMTSVLLAAAAAGTLLGGLAAQRLGRRLVLVVPQLVLAPAIAFLPSLSYGAMIPLVVVIGVAMNTNMSITLVLAQEYLPARMGLATGLTVGLCGGAGGLIVAALGLLGDSAGPAAVVYVIAALPLLVGAVSATLPRPAAAPPETLWGRHAEVRG